MIAVKTPAAPPKLLTAWATEKLRATQAFARGIPKAKFKFSAYASPGVKDTLEQSFHGKCAYCESLYKGVSHGDIEHYRPKAYVDLAANRRAVGYYWLAGEMCNLLPSCRNCNTPSRQEIAGKPVPEKVGKGNWFPIADERKRAAKAGDETKEYRLLISPYEDNPGEYLEFAETGLVAPVRSLRHRKKKRAEESIRLYGLSRKALVRLREDHGKRVLGQLKLLRSAYRAWQATPGNAALKREVIEEWRELLKLLTDDQPYLAMSRRIVAEKIQPAMRKAITKLVAPASGPRHPKSQVHSRRSPSATSGRKQRARRP